MIGIYKITNNKNNHSYIGQSREIETRWKNHKIAAFNQNDKCYDYPLYRAFRKYGLSSFNFEILELCEIEKLNERETYWINYYHSEYNQTIGGDYQVVPNKLTYEQVQEIQNILIADTNGEVSHKELAQQYNLNKDSIRDINVGRTWFNDKLTYPLHYSKFDANNPNKIQNKKYCKICGCEISNKATYCIKCSGKLSRQVDRPNREELKKLIRNTPFTRIGQIFNVSDNTIRKWCKAENLPSTVSEIKKYSDIEWQNI